MAATSGHPDESTGKQLNFYPALSVPLGPGVKTLNCPSRHLEWFAEDLCKRGPINLLSIGYSGMDTDVLELMADAGCAVKTALAVCSDGATAHAALSRIGHRLQYVSDPLYASLSDTSETAR